MASTKNEDKDRTPRDGRWNFEDNRWEHRTGTRKTKTITSKKTKKKIKKEVIEWGPWKKSTKRAPAFSQKALADKLKAMRELVDAGPQTKSVKVEDKSVDLEAEIQASICLLGKHFHKSNSAIKKKIRALVVKVVGRGDDNKKARKDAYDALTKGIPDYTASELKEKAKQQDQSFLAEDITKILDVKLFGLLH